MISIKNLFIEGPGPSSQYSIHPYRAAKDFKDECRDITTIKVTLYGKFISESEENFTVQALKKAISPYVAKIVLDDENEFPKDITAAKFQAYTKEKSIFAEKTYFFNKLGEESEQIELDTSKSSTSELLEWTYENGRTIWEYAIHTDSSNLIEYMEVKWSLMLKTINIGLEVEGGLPGTDVKTRRASLFLSRAIKNRDFIQELSKTIAYSLAVIEESASGKFVVGAPTAESAGIIPAVLFTLKETYKLSDIRVVRGLLTAGMIGKLLFKEILNGNIYTDIIIATAMASAAATQIMGGTPKQIIAAASIALNNLDQEKKRTISPHLDYIELNALGATNALNHATWALLSDKNLSKEIDFFYKITMEDSYLLI